MHLNMADRCTELGGSLGKLLEKSPTGTFGRDQERGRERFPQVFHNHLHIISVSSIKWRQCHSKAGFKNESVLSKNELSIQYFYLCISYCPNTSIFSYNRTLVSEFPDDTVYGWWIGATDLNRYFFAFLMLPGC